MSSSLVNKNSLKMADARPVNCERKRGQNSNFKTKITHTTVVPESVASRRVPRDHPGPSQTMQKHLPKKIASAGSLPTNPSPPTTPNRSSLGTRKNILRGRAREQRHGQPDLTTTTSKPGSSLSAYRPLPSIGQSGNDTEINTGFLNLGLNESDRAVHTPGLDSGVQHSKGTCEQDGEVSCEGAFFSDARMKRSLSLSSETSNTRKISRREMRSQQFARKRHSQNSLIIADEPLEGDERLLIAVKLPEGERLQRYFRPSDSINDIVSYAEHKTQRSFSDCNVFTSDVPKRMISDLSVTINNAGLINRTLLYLEEKDD